MSTPLDWYPRPQPDTGLGLHDSHLTGDSPPDLAQHAANLRAAGISWYKLLAGGVNKVERARIYVEHGIMPIVRLYVSEPHDEYVPPADQVEAYVEVGAPYIEAGNEPNLKEEWHEWPGWSDFGERLGAQWIKAADVIKSAGGIPVFYAMTPGGHFFHRQATIDTIEYVEAQGRLDTFERAVIGIHPRPLNNPPDTPQTEQNTTTWNEHRWYIDHWTAALGWTPPFVCTEHGYSPEDSQNADWPPMDEAKWAAYNRGLFERMNPDHPKAVDSHIFALCYWLEKTSGGWRADTPFKEGEWIDSGPRPDDRAWGKELWQIQPAWNRSVESAPPPEEPAPEPLPRPPGVPARELLNVPGHIHFTWHDAQPGETYWRLTKFRFRDSDESEGKTNIFSWEPHDPSVSLMVRNQNDSVWSVPHDKPADEPGANFGKSSGNVYEVWIGDGQGTPSDRAHGLTLPQNQHVVEDLWWHLVTEPEETPTPEPEPEPMPESEYVLGADVSHHQGIIDWQQMFDAGIRFALIKATEGTSFVDPQLDTNAAGARDVQIMRGYYHYWRNDMAPLRQAQHFAEHLPASELPPILDLEHTDGVPADIQYRVLKFLHFFEDSTGLRPLIYTGQWYLDQHFGEPVWLRTYPLWIADWTEGATKPAVPNRWAGAWDFWQWTAQADGSTYGVQSEHIDLDYFNGDIEALANYVHSVPSVSEKMRWWDEEKARQARDAGDLYVYANAVRGLAL